MKVQSEVRVTTVFGKAWQAAKICPIALAMAGAASGQQAAAPAPDAVVFALRQGRESGYVLEPLFEYRNGRPRTPSRVDEGTNCRTFAEEYLRAGRSYRVLFGGARAGTAKLESGEKAAVSFGRALRLAGEMALATDSNIMGRTTGSRRAPTAEERTAALELARSEYRRRGIAVPAHFAEEQLTSTDVNRDGAQELIGAWRIDGQAPARSYSLFFVAERSGGAYRLGLVNYHAGGGETYGFEQFVDHADVDGDGKDELITRAWGWEWYTNRVYSRRGRGWVRIYEGPGCEGM